MTPIQNNYYGQLGIDNTEFCKKFKEIPLNNNITTIKAIYKSYKNTFILTNDGLYGCGCNQYNQLGIEHYIHLSGFVKIPFYQTIINVLVCFNYTIIWSIDGLYAYIL